MSTPGKPSRPMLRLVLLAGLVAVPIAPVPSGPVPSAAVRGDREAPRPTALDSAPPEVRAFLDRVLGQVPEGGAGVSGYEFRHWERPGKPTRAALGIKAIPGVDPRAMIARVMDVDGYKGRIAHVDACRSVPDPACSPPASVHFYQRLRIPGVARVQQEAVLVDAGTIKGYRVACWYLLPEETASLDPRDGARNEASVGAWLAAPGVVCYAFGGWPRRGDVNALQWLTLTAGADALAGQVVEGAIDGMASWSREGSDRALVQSASATRTTSTVRPPDLRTMATSGPHDQTASPAPGPAHPGSESPGPVSISLIGRPGSE